MADITMDKINLVIEADVKKAVSGLDLIQKKLAQFSAQINKNFSTKSDIDMAKPLEKAALTAQKAANAIIKEQTRLQESMRLIQEKTQAKIETSLLREQAARIKAQSTIDKQAESQKKLADASKVASDQIIRQQKDIESAVTRANARMQAQVTGGVYKQKTVPSVGAQTATSTNAFTTQNVTASENAIKFTEASILRINQITDTLGQVSSRVSGVMAANFETINQKIIAQQGLLDLLRDKYVQSVQVGGITEDSGKIQSQILSAESSMSKLVQQYNGAASAANKTVLETSKLSRVAGVTKSAFSAVSSVISKILGGASGLVAMFKKVGNSAKNSAQKATSAFSKLGETIKRVLIIGALYKGFRELFTFISDGLKAAINAPEIENLFRVALKNMSEEAAAFADQLRKSLGIDPYVTKEMLGTFQNLSTSMGIGENSAYKMSKSLTLLANDMASLYNVEPSQAAENLQSAITGQWRAVRKYGYVLSETVIQQTAWRHGIAATGQELTEQQKVIARYITLLEQSGNAQGDMARTIGSVQNQLRILRQNVTAAGRAIGEAFLPFIEAAIPWLNAFFVVLQRAGTALARFTYGLFGKNYDAEKKKQQEAITGLGNVADAQDKVGESAEESAKKIEGSLSPYDKLNLIQSKALENANAGDTGNLEIPGLPELEAPNIESPIEKMADKIIDFFKNHSWLEIGQILAEKINQAVASVDWYALGEKIGRFLQNAISFAYGFLTTLDWNVLGKALANLIMGTFSQINWNMLGATIAAGINGVYSFLLGFVQTIDWAKIGKYISDTITGFFNQIDLKTVALSIATLINGVVTMMYEAVVNTDWMKIARQIGEAVNTFFSNVDWAKLGTTIGLLFQTILRFMGEIVKTIDWGQIWQAVVDVFTNSDWITKILIVAIPAINFLKDAIGFLFPIISTALGWFKLFGGGAAAAGTATAGAATAASSFGGIAAIASLAAKGFSAALAFLTSPIGLIILGIVGLIAVIVLLIKNWEAVKETAKKVWDFIKESWSVLTKWFEDTTQKFIDKLQEIVAPFGDFISAIMGALKGSFEGFMNFITGAFAGNWSRAWQGIKQVFGSVWEGMKGIVQSARNYIMNIVNAISDGVKNAINWVKELIGLKEKESRMQTSSGGSSSKSGDTRARSMPITYSFATSLDIPKAAKGAVLTRSTIINGGEYAGASTNPEIVTPQSIMYDTVVDANSQITSAFDKAMSRMTARIVTAIRENAIEADKSGMFKIIQEMSTDYQTMTGSPAF